MQPHIALAMHFGCQTFLAMQVYVRFRQGSGVRRMKQEAAGEIARRAVDKPNFGAGDV